MLPALNKNKETEYKQADSKVYHPPKQLSQYDPKKDNMHQSARSSAKGKVGGGFRISSNYEQPKQVDSLKSNDYVPHQVKTINYANFQQKKSSNDINLEIKMIERKIRQCQRKIEQQKKQKIQQQRRNQENMYEKDFEQIIKKELELQGFNLAQKENNHFDYLTNPGGLPQQEEMPIEQLVQQETTTPYNISEGIQKLEKFYENSLKKKFERREAFPHKACKRKTPKLYITQKTNALSKHGKPLTEEQHKFRVITRQITPQQIYPVIPNFAVVKDNLSKNIVAYLGDYKPFIDKTKEKVQKEMKKQNNQIMVENLNKSASVAD